MWLGKCKAGLNAATRNVLGDSESCVGNSLKQLKQETVVSERCDQSSHREWCGDLCVLICCGRSGNMVELWRAREALVREGGARCGSRELVAQLDSLRLVGRFVRG